MEERRDQCQLEVSLCSQAIDYVQQRWIRREILSIQYTNKCLNGLTPSFLALQHPIEVPTVDHVSTSATPMSPNEPFSIESVPLSNAPAVDHLAHAPEQRTTWVTPCVQEAFNEAHKAELGTQAGLMATYLEIERYHSHHRNANLELLYLQAKMLRAKAEVDVFEQAIENACASNYTDSVFSSNTHAIAASSRPTLFQTNLPKQVNIYKECIPAGSISDRTDSTYGNSLVFVTASMCTYYLHVLPNLYIIE
ncbi:uncharacterized protein F5891DRAFT_984896 [Suillus fuscotomentosus]|uniref:Uncharacterized protein n=1 Tax=Suillus fuscotomentosus TaxID=1912939 RepID=A0AAD4DVB7_9AGAM|nr:uncharacterized protein F5891DRAFT_984896 [Suillus fuscotomentosus]KAG1894624.1 hypothetical protein F5891DRAFT_984896 [Suillus fuscotomentosus]